MNMKDFSPISLCVVLSKLLVGESCFEVTACPHMMPCGAILIHFAIFCCQDFGDGNSSSGLAPNGYSNERKD